MLDEATLKDFAHEYGLAPRLADLIPTSSPQSVGLGGVARRRSFRSCLLPRRLHVGSKGKQRGAGRGLLCWLEVESRLMTRAHAGRISAP